MQNQKKHSSLLVILIFSLLVFKNSANGQAPQNIHLIKIFDFHTEIIDERTHEDKSYKIRYGAKKFESYITSKSQKVADKLSLPLKQYSFYDKTYIEDPLNSRFSKHAIDEDLLSIECENDIIIIAVFAHGFGTNTNENKTDSVEYPYIILNYNRDISDSKPYYDILKTLNNKKPSLILSIVNTCQETVDDKTAYNINNRYNGYLRSFNANFVTAGGGTKIDENEFFISEDNIEKLFTKPEVGSPIGNETVLIDLVSCSNGEYTYVDEEGGHFISSFMSVFDEQLSKNENVDWFEIALQTKLKTEKSIKSYNEYLKTKKSSKYHVQTPQCYVSLLPYNSIKPKYLQTSKTIIPNPDDNPNPCQKTIVINKDFYSPYNSPSYKFAIRLTKLANTYIQSGQPDYAIEALDVALPVLKSNNDKYFEATAYENKGWAYLDKGDNQKAIENFKIAMQKFDEIGCCGSATTIRAKLVQLGVKPSELTIKCN